MTIEYAVRAPADDGELDAFVEHACDAFLGSAAHTRSWIGRAGEDRVRIVHDGERVVGGLAATTCAQFFGGRAVSCLAVAGVAVGSPHRGQGAASALMRETLREARRNDVALSTLYASNHGLYRGVGYEPAGSLYELQIRLPEIGGSTSDLGGVTVRFATAEDEPALQALYRARAQRHDGHVDRNRFLWHHARHVGEARCRVALVEQDGRPTGYLAYHQRATGDVVGEMIVREFVPETPEALRRLLAFVVAHGCQIGTVVFVGASPDHEALQAMREPFLAVRRFETWMTRIVDVPRALEERGYPRGMSARFDLDVHDPLFDDNAGRWRVTVADGRATAERGGEGTARIDVRGLAALFTGFATPRGLELQGLGEGLEHVPAGVFGSRGPVCADLF